MSNPKILFIDIEGSLYDVWGISSITKKDWYDAVEICWKYDIIINKKKEGENANRDGLPEVVATSYYNMKVRDERMKEIKIKLSEYIVII